MVGRVMAELAKHSLVSYDGEKIEASPEQRIKIASETIQRGADAERVCRFLRWREFEEMASLFLRESGYTVVKNLHFKASGKRWEVDATALREPLVLSIDCKHWKRSWQTAATRRMAEMQRSRTRYLASTLPTFRDRLKIGSWRRARVLPLVVTLRPTPFRICGGVPVVPIYNLRSLLSELQANLHLIAVYDVTFPFTADRSEERGQNLGRRSQQLQL